MKNIFLIFFLLLSCLTLSSCQGFFDDYGYSPIGSGYNSNGTY